MGQSIETANSFLSGALLGGVLGSWEKAQFGGTEWEVEWQTAKYVTGIINAKYNNQKISQNAAKIWCIYTNMEENKVSVTFVELHHRCRIPRSQWPGRTLLFLVECYNTMSITGLKWSEVRIHI